MYWRGMPHFDPDELAWNRRLEERKPGEKALLAALSEMVKYLAITAAIYLILAVVIRFL
ncbi:MAG TPA: hypothetical protein VMU31_04900 [Rhizomicrobium sp.]|nr:hypothetical protein [Rhizomicrobium sp.]